MNFFIDIATLTSVSTLFYVFLLAILLVFWRQNTDIEAVFWWCGFPFFHMINSYISSDSIQYENELFIYIGNYSIILSDLFLMIGCFKFSKFKIHWRAIYAYLTLFFIVCVYLYFISADLVLRTQVYRIIRYIPDITLDLCFVFLKQ